MGSRKIQRPIVSTSASMIPMTLPGSSMRSRLAPPPKRVQISGVSWLLVLSLLKAVSIIMHGSIKHLTGFWPTDGQELLVALSAITTGVSVWPRITSSCHCSSLVSVSDRPGSCASLCPGYRGYPFENKEGKGCLENCASEMEKEEKIV
jgi:hypothetical protein